MWVSGVLVKGSARTQRTCSRHTKRRLRSCAASASGFGVARCWRARTRAGGPARARPVPFPRGMPARRHSLRRASSMQPPACPPCQACRSCLPLPRLRRRRWWRRGHGRAAQPRALPAVTRPQRRASPCTEPLVPFNRCENYHLKLPGLGHRFNPRAAELPPTDEIPGDQGGGRSLQPQHAVMLFMGLSA